VHRKVRLFDAFEIESCNPKAALDRLFKNAACDRATLVNYRFGRPTLSETTFMIFVHLDVILQPFVAVMESARGQTSREKEGRGEVLWFGSQRAKLVHQ
jgi:hypothetical protein